jgi:hypothetical protein
MVSPTDNKYLLKLYEHCIAYYAPFIAISSAGGNGNSCLRHTFLIFVLLKKKTLSINDIDTGQMLAAHYIS